MPSKRVASFLAVLAAILAFEFCPVGAAAQNISRISVKSTAPLTRSFSIPKSPRPLTPAEKMFTSRHKNVKPHHMTAPSLPTSATQIFKTAITSSSGASQTYNAATGDLNGDGKLDVVMASQCNASNNCSSGAVTVLLGNGDGTYQTPVSYAAGSSTRFVALSDVNGDGKLDILAASYCNSDCSSGTVNVLLGNGDGTFQAAAAYNTGTSSSIALVVSDVNGDSKPDLLVLDQCVGSCSTGALSVLLGNGDGTFQTAVLYAATGDNSQGIAAADLNGDGKLDVAIVNGCNSNNDCSGGSVSVFLGNGDGTFQNAVSVNSVGINSNAVAIGDVNSDGHADLVVSNQCNNNSNCTSGTVSVSLGNGDGTFQTAVQYPSGGLYAQSVALGDLNGDGKLDIATTNECQSNTGCQNGNSTGILLGNGDGTFQLNASYAAGTSNFEEMEGPSLSTVSLADTNGDGKLDVLVTNSCSGADFDCGVGAVNVLLGYGDGTLQAGIIYPVTGSANGLATADVNGDGKPDVIVANECNTDCSAGTVSILINNGDGTFQTGNTYPSGGQYTLWAAAGDLNGDGKADIVLSNQCGVPNVCSSSSVSVLLGNGDGTFQSATSYSLTSTNGQSIVLGDVNGDGKLDVVVVFQCDNNNCNSGGADVLLGNGDGTFQPAVDYSAGGLYTLGASIGDVNGDGKADLVLISECNSSNNCTNGVASVLLGNGDGTFQPAVTYSTIGVDANSMQLADLNGDGKLDIVAENECASNNDCSTGSLVVLLGNGDGTFQTGVTTNMNSQFFFSQSLVVADFNGDQKLDVAFGGADTFLLGNGDGTFQAPMYLGASGSGSVVADFNGDGRPDLALGGVTILLNISNGFKVQTTTTLNSSSNPSSFGQSVTFTATVTPQAQGNPSGTVIFADGETQLGQVTLANGTATYTTSALGIGSHSITASYSGDSNYGSSNSTTLNQAVGVDSTTTTLSGAPNPANVAQSVTFTATVTPSSSGTPTGSVSFYDGESLLGNVPLNAGVATYSTSNLAAATHSITAIYSGDNNYGGSNSNTLSEVVSAQGFTLSSTALTPATISAGGSAQWTIAINPAGGLDPSTVSLSCAVTPVVTPAVSCSVSSVTVSGGVGSATLHVGTTAPHTAAQRLAKNESGSGKLLMLALLFPGLVLGGAGISKSNRGKLLGFGIALLVLSACMFQTACGGASSSGTPVPGTPNGAYTVTVTGSANSMQQTTTVQLTVQ